MIGDETYDWKSITIKTVSVISFAIIFITVATLAFPNMLHPAYGSTNANLFVSAENSQWNNYFAGPQVIQVIVADPDIARLDQAYGEPVVTVNGKKLRMAQAEDGMWYAYFADSKQAQIADSTAPIPEKGLNFGQFCSAASAVTATGVDFTQTKGVAIGSTATGAIEGKQNPAATITATCTSTASSLKNEHVVRESKALNLNAPGSKAGQISTNNAGFLDAWPVIQLYDFSATPMAVTVDYQKSGGDQVVNLTFDRIPQNLISVIPDRSTYPENSQVFLTMNDPQLNIDPTEEDSWTWGTSATNNTLYYQAFDRNGSPDADGTAGMQNLEGNLTKLMFNHNGKLTINPTAQSSRVIDFESNYETTYNGIKRGDPAAVSTRSIAAGSQPLSFVEGGVNTGIFGTWDTGEKSEIVTINDPSIRGQSATFQYNDISGSIVGGFAFGTISEGSTSLAKDIPVTLADNDLNLNSKRQEFLNFYDPIVTRVPTMVIGTPFTLSSGGVGSETAQLVKLAGSPSFSSGIGTAQVLSISQNAVDVQEDEATSQRPIFSFSSTGTTEINSTTALLIDLKTTMSTLLGTVHNTNRVGNAENFTGFNFLNYDLLSLSYFNGAAGSPITNIGINLVYNNAGTGLTSNGKIYSSNPTLVHIADSTNLKDFINLNYTDIAASDLNNNLFGTVTKNANIGILVTFTTDHGNDLFLPPGGEPIAIDFFSIGLIGNNVQKMQGINNGIYRFELTETGNNTGVFSGTNHYFMLNQLNIFDHNTYAALRTIGKDVRFAAITSMQSGSGAPTIGYLDLGADGINTKISAQKEITTHTGTISTDKKTYNVGDTVIVTLADADLDVDESLVVIYTTVAPSHGINQPEDVAVDTVGVGGLGVYSNGQPVGELVSVGFGSNKIRWSNSVIPGDPHHGLSCFGTESPSGTSGGYATSLSASGFSLVETGVSTGIFTGSFQMPDQLCQDGALVPSIAQVVHVRYFDFLDSTGQPSIAAGNSLAFPLKPGGSSDKRTYPNGNSITVPFVSVNNTDLTIHLSTGTYFPNGDTSNHNNMYVPEQPRPSDPTCRTGQFYSGLGQCLAVPDMCEGGSSPDANGKCHVGGADVSPTACSIGHRSDQAGMCSSDPQCSGSSSYDTNSGLCVPNTWPVDCNLPDRGNLNQEGWVWTLPPGTVTIRDRTHGQDINTVENSTGFVVQWTMPSGSTTGYKAGVFYNPVNFDQNVPNDPTKYMFYQVDYGIGGVLGNRNGWMMTFEKGGSGDYSFIKLDGVPILPGSKYWITGVLEPAPLANPPAYVVQIVQGTQSWVYETKIDEIDPKSSPVYRFQSFQDQWISTPFASDLTRDEISYPTIISTEDGSITLGSFLTSATPYTSVEQANINSTFKLLSPHLMSMSPSQPYTYSDSRDCQGYGNPSTDIDDLAGIPPSDPLRNSQYTVVHTPTIPEFGPLVGIITIVSIISVIAITRKYSGKY